MCKKQERFAIAKIDGEWSAIRFKDLRKGMLFYLYNHDEKPVKNPNTKHLLFKALGDAFLSPDGRWYINYE